MYLLTIDMRTFIHIGQHKTGTTSIQHCLRLNRGEFIRQGLYLPDSIAGFNNPSHFILNVYSLNTQRQSSMKEKLLSHNMSNPCYMSQLSRNLKKDVAKHYQHAYKEGCTDIIWTNEGLYLLNTVEEYTRLYNLFAPHSTEIICIICFREVESFKRSYTKQLEKQGIPFSENRDSYKYIKDDSWLFNYKEKRKLLHSVFGSGVHVLTYDPDDMIRLFFDKLGYSILPSQVFRLNTSQ